MYGKMDSLWIYTFLNKKRNYFFLTTCGGLSGGDSREMSCRSVLFGTPFKLVESFFKGRGLMLVDSTLWETSELLNQTPLEDESEAAKQTQIETRITLLFVMK